MPPLSVGALRQQLADAELAPLYVLTGADESAKSEMAAQFGDVVEEGLRPFNLDRLYGGETTIDAVIDAARTLPMMAPRRLVVVLEAEKLLSPKRESKAADQAQLRLEEFVKAPPPHAAVVFVCGALDLRRRVTKLLLSVAFVVDCGSVEDAGDAERWVKARAARQGVSIEPAAVRTLVERAGLDLTRLRAGFDRLVLYALNQPAITADDVRHVVSPGPEAQEHFGIANAIRDRDARAALRQVGAGLEAGAAPFFLMGQMRSAAERLPPARLEPAMDALFRTDAALKSSGGDPRILLERLVVELCEEGQKPRVRRRT